MTFMAVTASQASLVGGQQSLLEPVQHIVRLSQPVPQNGLRAYGLYSVGQAVETQTTGRIVCLVPCTEHECFQGVSLHTLPVVTNALNVIEHFRDREYRSHAHILVLPTIDQLNQSTTTVPQRHPIQLQRIDAQQIDRMQHTMRAAAELLRLSTVTGGLVLFA